MNESQLYALKFPLGEFDDSIHVDAEAVQNWIAEIASFPQRMKDLTEGLSVEQSNWRYRPEGWTIKQVVHHCADSHLNSLVRFKLALTEEEPKIRPYYEDRWAQLVDGQDDDLSYSLMLLEGLHYRWVKLLRGLSPIDLKRGYLHPEFDSRVALEQAIGLYAWHGNHHLAHVRQAVAFRGEFL
ncbi:metal-dependent hydrolase [Reichenbachiella sp. 5M10]|uniref:YfiT family bacillithiol transferase n=1 Tax=Reichenbachiella sp. 5M10 TaxID=1889772 RepID=UPI000C158C89|nr:putative metal-dependent hydrolase [Reichenbachiella sp. 5M10]PIB36922.1 metal-dependent hydrolase [Reichenbachiella sp. 5M10]